MNVKTTFLGIFALVTMIFLSLAACGGGGPNPGPLPGPSPVSSPNPPVDPSNPPATKSFTLGGIGKTATKNFSPNPPSLIPGVIQRDVKFDSNAVSIRAEVKDLIIIDKDGYGWQNNAGISSGGVIGSGLATPIKVYAKNASNQWYEATTNYEPVDLPSNDPQTLSPTSLGLPEGTAASDVVTAMHDRWMAAKDDGDSPPFFYPIFRDQFNGTVNGSYHFTQIFGGSPIIRFIAEGDKVRVFACSNIATDSTITFDVVVIKSDGMGWFTAGSNKVIPQDYLVPSEVSTMNFFISSITSTKIGSVSGLASEGCVVYAIVRKLGRYGALDLNQDDYLKQVNVIRIYPDAEISDPEDL